MKQIEQFLNYIENLVSRGDTYYDKIIKSSHIVNIVYVIAITFFGIQIFQDEWLYNINTGIRIAVCILLLLKFHPFREHEFKQSDSTLIFSSAIFLLFNLSIIEIVKSYTDNIRKQIKLSI